MLGILLMMDSLAFLRRVQEMRIHGRKLKLLYSLVTVLL